MGSSSINLEEIAGDLDLAATALNGPVTVAGNAEGGPTVAYLNETGVAQECGGFTLPYSTVDEGGVDPSTIDLSDLAALPELLQVLEGGGGVSILGADEEGNPTASDSPGFNFGSEDIMSVVLGLANGLGVAVPAGESAEWTATEPEDPAAGVILCLEPGQNALADIEMYFGVDPQVVAGQINGRIPGGSVAPVSAGSISGGSVEMGANLLGPLTAASSEDGEDEGSGSSFMSSGFSEAGSGGDDTGELPPLESVE
ncbi:hypothetical protein [Dietzia massiliensis]|uniref:hypothetical protein n=1 Tax=Dietzia massiliensis TaxID=2697499 RepID=UPI001BCFCBFC|nr:hypothetical protein [Dietzia massiliensis]MBS7548554.1 hypothetical protein [Dietzia massiliensis]